jgi:putative transposase
MIWFLMMHLFSTLMEWIRIGQLSEREKDLEILLLRKQLAIVERKLDKPLRVSRAERLILAVLATKLKSIKGYTIKQLGEVIRIFQPETVFKWHRELVRRKWTYEQKRRGGRPRMEKEVEQLVVRFARENNDWGRGKIQGELAKLGYQISETTIANILRWHNIPPAPERSSSTSWRHLMRHYKDQLLACDFFTVETLFLKTLYVLFFIELGTRRVYFAGCTMHPNSAWVTQQARQLTWILENRVPDIRFLIHDNDTKFTRSFDNVFEAEGIDAIHTPFQAPNANAYAERWIRTVREECLDKLLIINQAHLRRVMQEFVAYHNTARPHQGIAQQVPIPNLVSANATGPVCRRDVLGGIVHDYYRKAA